MTGWATTARRAIDGAMTAWLRLPWISRWALWIAGAFLLLVARRPETLFSAEFYNEDGQVYYLAPFFLDPIDVILRPWGGCLVVVPRLVSLILQAVPPAVAPVWANAISLLIVAGIAAFIASDRLALVVPNRPLRHAIALGFLLVPGSFETLGSITDLQWYLAVPLLLMSMTGSPASLAGRLTDAVVVLLAAFTGPFSILFAPWYWIRFAERRDRISILLAATVSIGALDQLSIVLTIGGRTPDPFPIFEVIGYRVVDALALGTLWTLLLTRAGVPDLVAFGATILIGAAMVSVVATVSWNRYGIRVLLATLAVLASSLAVLRGGYRDLLIDAAVEARYFLLPAIFVTTATLVALATDRGRPRAATRFLGALLLVAVIGDFRIPAHDHQDWAGRSSCIGSTTPCDIPVDPVDRWTVHWPGSNGVYVQPLK